MFGELRYMNISFDTSKRLGKSKDVVTTIFIPFSLFKINKIKVMNLASKLLLKSSLKKS